MDGKPSSCGGGRKWWAGVVEGQDHVAQGAVVNVDSTVRERASVTANRSCISACGPRGGSQPRLALTSRSARVRGRGRYASARRFGQWRGKGQGHPRLTGVVAGTPAMIARQPAGGQKHPSLGIHPT